MKSLFRSLLVAIAGAALTSAALAQNPNIDPASVVVTQNAGIFTVSGTLAGLGSGTTAIIKVEGVINGEAYCVTKSGNRTGVGSASDTGSGTATYTTKKNGNIKFSLGLSSQAVIDALKAIECRGSQRQELIYQLLSMQISVDVKYSDSLNFLELGVLYETP